jgi:hypothetical protein
MSGELRTPKEFPGDVFIARSRPSAPTADILRGLPLFLLFGLARDHANLKRVPQCFVWQHDANPKAGAGY